MAATAPGRQSPLAKGLVLLIGIGVLAMFVTSVLYRMEHPSRQLAARPQAPAGGQGGMAGMMGGMGGEDMNALRALMQQMSENPNDIGIQIELAKRFAGLGAWERSLMFAQNAVNLQPSNAEALNLFGLSLFRLERYKEAESAYQQLASVDSKSVMAQYNLGVIYKHFLNDPKKGEDHFRKALALKPEDVRVQEMIRAELGETKEHGQ